MSPWFEGRVCGFASCVHEACSVIWTQTGTRCSCNCPESDDFQCDWQCCPFWHRSLRTSRTGTCSPPDAGCTRLCFPYSLKWGTLRKQVVGFIQGLFKLVQLWHKVGPFNVDVSLIVGVEQLLTELTRIVAGEVLVLYVVNHVMFLNTSLGALQTLKQVDI